MHDLPILINIAVALAAALAGGLLARLVKLPMLVGYLLAGIVIGPFTPGYTGDLGTIRQLAELGIIFLMFGVGLHFSLKDLWAVRRIAIPGALLQMFALTLLVWLIAPLLGWSQSAAILIGIAISIASTVVMLRNLMDQGLLNTSHGQAAVGWLVVEDLVTVLILVLLPALTSETNEPILLTAGLALLKAIVFAGLMLVVGTRIIPWLLGRLAHTGSRELFVVAIVMVTMGTALAASTFFGVSLALGAFLAGVVISESSLSHQVGAEILPFRELFTVLFFVSVGMLVNPQDLWNSLGGVIGLTLLVIVGKFLLTIIFGIFFIPIARTTLVLAVGRSQIAEFSFILGETGVSLGLLLQEQYSLLLVAAIISVMVNPFLFRLLPYIERFVQKNPFLWRLLNKSSAQIPLPESETETVCNHVIVVGYGRVGEHIVRVLGLLNIPRLVVDLDLQRIARLDKQGVATLYGDAANSEILSHARIADAKAVVITVPSEASAEIIVATIRHMNSDVPIIVRASTQDGIQELRTLGANDVIHPELEGGLNIVQQTLTHLGYNRTDIQDYTDAVRQDRYDLSVSTRDEQEALQKLNAEKNLSPVPD